MRRHDERDERGAVLVMVVLLMVVLLTFTAFAVDLGTQRVARRDMQSVADAAAMDLARQLKGRTASAIEADPAWARVKNQAVEQNTTTVGTMPALTPVLGAVDTVTGEFTPVTGNAVPTAVKVIAATSVRHSFVPGEGTAARSSIASVADPVTCFSVGSSLLALNTSDSALGPLLDRILTVRLGVLNPAGLLDVKGIEVPLADIAIVLGAATPQALLDKTNVSLRDFILSSATALSKNGHTAQAAVLQAIGVQISGVSLDLADILKLDIANEAGLGAQVNVLDLVTAAIFAANGTNALNVKNLAATIPGIGGIEDLSVAVTQPPQIACGRAGVTAKSAQLTLHLKVGLNPLNSDVADTSLELNLEVGRGEGSLKSVSCGAVNKAVITARTGGVVLSGPTEPDHKALLSLRTRDLLNLFDVLSVSVKLGASVGVGSGDLTFATTPGATVPSQSVTSSSLLKLERTDIDVRVLGSSAAVTNAVLNGVLNDIVQPLINGPVNLIVSGLIYPLTNLLGIKIAQTDVRLHDSVDCTNVQLVG
jgi:uncharacterized membrane protein